jgi:hypothetical protein
MSLSMALSAPLSDDGAHGASSSFHDGDGDDAVQWGVLASPHAAATDAASVLHMGASDANRAARVSPAAADAVQRSHSAMPRSRPPALREQEAPGAIVPFPLLRGCGRLLSLAMVGIDVMRCNC